MVDEDVPAIELAGPMDLSLPDGSLVRIRPGPYGKGIALVPLEKQQARTSAAPNPGKPGRRPRESTVRLRERLGEDLEDGGLRPNTEYVQWMLSIDETLSLPVARQIVYRERKRTMHNND